MKKKAANYVGYASERTTEYILIPDIIRKLEARFPHVMPMYFWANREGGRQATRSMGGRVVKIVSAFARRPKVSESDPDVVRMKVNGELLSYAQSSARAGIPVLAGIPLCASLFELRPGVACAWYDISQCSSNDEECILTIPLPAGSEVNLAQSSLSDSSLVELCSDARDLYWDEAVIVLKELKDELRQRRNSFLGGYQPFHLILYRE